MIEMDTRKGLSPFIAMALLVAIVVAAATIVGHWVGPFAEYQTEAVENQTEEFHACTDVHIDILDAHYDDGEVQLTVMNAGFADLPDLTAVLLGAGAVIDQTDIGDATSGEIASTTIDVADGTPEQVVVVSPVCPMITDEESL